MLALIAQSLYILFRDTKTMTNKMVSAEFVLFEIEIIVFMLANELFKEFGDRV